MRVHEVRREDAMPRMRSVLARAGYPELLASVSPEILAVARGVYVDALAIAAPRAVSWTFAGGDIPDGLIPPALEGFPRYAVLSVTLGRALDERIDERFAAGSPLEGALFDAWGSEAAEVLARAVDRALRGGSGEGGTRSVRFAPGYGGFDVRNNARWFALAGANAEADAGVTADPATGILSPRKSILCMIGWNQKKAM